MKSEGAQETVLSRVSFMKVQFQTVDVFTDRRFGGNPLAVIPDARGVSDAQMQAIAKGVQSC